MNLSSMQTLERTEKPLLALAGVAILLYLLELFHLIPDSLALASFWLNFLIDLTFLTDLVLKALLLGKDYLKGPWFLIDLLSTLPIISSGFELVGASGIHLEAARSARAMRLTRTARISRAAKLTRIVRVAGVLKALRMARGLRFLSTMPEEFRQTPQFNRAMKIGVPLLLVAFLGAARYLQQAETRKLESSVRLRVVQADSLEDIRTMPEYLDTVDEINPLLEVIRLSKVMDGKTHELSFSLHEAAVRADRQQGFLLMFMMFTIAGAAYVTSSLSADEQKSQRLHLLSQCFSPAVVKKLTQSPEVMDRFYEQWMSVFFVDIRGFTQASEASREDIEGLALRLRNVMDIGYREIVVTHEGIVDKFMGDAIMGWIGGHFSKHWDIFAAERRALLADEIEEATQDLRAVERAIRARETGAGLSGERRVNDSVSPAELETDLAQLNEAKRRIQAGLEDLADRRRTAIQENPGLDERYETRVLAYKRAVARSAAMCCLTIWDEVSNQDAAEAFTELKIGIASGPVMVGNFGATRQVGFTVLGPTVNRAARLEPASAQCGCKILVDQDTFALLGDDPELVFRELPVISVKGVDADLRVYEPLRKDGVSSQALNAFRLAAEAILADRLADAIERLREADRLWEGGDHASQLWAKECEKAVREGYSLKFRKMSK